MTRQFLLVAGLVGAGLAALPALAQEPDPAPAPFPPAATADEIPGEDRTLVTPPMAPDAIQGPGARNPVAPQPLAEVGSAVFVTNATSFLTLAIGASRLADTQAGSERITALAREMASVHLDAREALQRAATTDRYDVGFPPSDELMVQGHEQLLLDLSAQAGADFDRRYVDMLVQIHRQMDEMFATYADAGDDPQIQVFAEEMLPVIRRHLQLALEIEGAG